MRAVITGITGFLGSHLSDHLLAHGDEVLGVARRIPDNPARDDDGEQTPDSRRAAPWNIVPWDLADSETKGGITDRTREQIAAFAPEVIFHFAALSNPRDCGQATPNALALQVNVDGARHVVSLANGLDSRPRVVFASTAHVYARPACGMTVHEESLLEPSRGYGISKLAAERVFRDAAARQGSDIVIARSFQHAGPRQEPRLMLSEWAAQLARSTAGGERRRIRVHNLDTMIDLTDGRDAAAAYRAIALRGAASRVYNIGAGTRQRTGDILECLFAAAGIRPPIEENEPGFRRNLIADVSRIREELGWRPIIPIDVTVRDALLWWRRRLARKPIETTA